MLNQRWFIPGILTEASAAFISFSNDTDNQEGSETDDMVSHSATNKPTNQAIDSTTSETDPSSGKIHSNSGNGNSNDASDLTREDVFPTLSFNAHSKVKTVIVAQWMRKTKADSVWIELNFEGGEWLKSPEVSRDVGQQQEDLLGVPEGLDVGINLVAVITDKMIESKISSTTNGETPSTMVKPKVENYD